MLLNIDLLQLQSPGENLNIIFPDSLSSAQTIRICITAHHVDTQTCNDLLSTLGNLIVDNLCRVLNEIKTIHPTVTISRITVDSNIQLYHLKNGIFDRFLEQIKSARIGCQVFQYERSSYTISLLKLFLLKGDDAFKIHVGEKEQALLYGRADVYWEQGVSKKRFGNFPDLVKNDEHETIEEIILEQEGRAKRKTTKREEYAEAEEFESDNESSEQLFATKRPRKITTPLRKGLVLSAEESARLKDSISQGNYEDLFYLRPKQIITFCRTHQLDGVAEIIIAEKKKASADRATHKFRLKEKLERELITPLLRETSGMFFTDAELDLTGVNFSQEQESNSQSGLTSSGFFSKQNQIPATSFSITHRP